MRERRKKRMCEHIHGEDNYLHAGAHLSCIRSIHITHSHTSTISTDFWKMNQMNCCAVFVLGCEEKNGKLGGVQLSVNFNTFRSQTSVENEVYKCCTATESESENEHIRTHSHTHTGVVELRPIASITHYMYA